MERILNNEITAQVKAVLDENLSHTVKILFFESEEHCEYCAQTRQLLEEIIPLHSLLSMESVDIQDQPEKAATYGIDKTPAIVLAGIENDETIDYGIRFYGIPVGHEFTSLINDIILVSRRDSGLKPATREFLQTLDRKIHLQVFVTPSCPYCPRAVTLAHAMALENPFVQADMIESTEFNELSTRYQVSGVPHTAINDGTFSMIGSGPEEMLVDEIRKSLVA